MRGSNAKATRSKLRAPFDTEMLAWLRARYRFDSEDLTQIRLKLKVKINWREHFSVHGFRKEQCAADSRWFAGNSDIATYEIDELLGTK